MTSSVVKVVRNVVGIVKIPTSDGVTKVVETVTGVLKVVSAGPPGPQGPIGPVGGQFVHSQGSPSGTWTINHNLGFRPNVTLLDTGGVEFDATVVHTSVNQAIATLAPALAGTAICS